MDLRLGRPICGWVVPHAAQYFSSGRRQPVDDGFLPVGFHRPTVFENLTICQQTAQITVHLIETVDCFLELIGARQVKAFLLGNRLQILSKPLPFQRGIARADFDTTCHLLRVNAGAFQSLLKTFCKSWILQSALGLGPYIRSGIDPTLGRVFEQGVGLRSHWAQM